MTKTEILNSEFYKSLSRMSNRQRGSFFDNYRSEVERILNVKLIKHSYTELSSLNEDNLLISYQTDSHGGPIIALMEFKTI